MSHESPRVHEARPDVLRLEPRIAAQDRIGAVAGREHPEDVLDREAPSPHDRLSPEYVRVDRDPLQKHVLVHRTRGYSRTGEDANMSEGITAQSRRSPARITLLPLRTAAPRRARRARTTRCGRARSSGGARAR